LDQIVRIVRTKVYVQQLRRKRPQGVVAKSFGREDSNKRGNFKSRDDFGRLGAPHRAGLSSVASLTGVLVVCSLAMCCDQL
jgi:hypothetical protein